MEFQGFGLANDSKLGGAALRRAAIAAHGVAVVDLRVHGQPGEFSEDLFALKQSVACDRLMQVMDDINERWGRGTMRAASVPATPDWGMRREMMSQSYTTRIDQLWTVKC